MSTDRISLDSLPEDLLLTIFSYCDIDTLLSLSITCHRIYVSLEGESFWKQKLQELYGDNVDVASKSHPNYGYKAACLRFCAVFKNTVPEDWSDCSRCQDIFCCTNCIQDRDEIIIFDFGSKTTWFKYASESFGFGQLSMHPTVAPFEQETADQSRSADSTSDIYQCCPVCCKMFSKQSASPLNKTVTDTKVHSSSRYTSRRVTSAFSRLAQRHFPSCFDSTNGNDDLAENKDALCSGLAGVNLGGNDGNHGSATSDQAALGPSSLQSKQDDCSKNEDSPTDQLQPSDSHSNSAHTGSVDMYKFLIMHMVKRNTFFQAKCIPFVVCEPTDCTLEMKVDILQFLFTELKVPGACYIPKPVATALYSGLDTCLVVDSGAHNTVVSPVIDQNVLSHCVQTKAVGGMFLSQRLMECVQLKGIQIQVDETSLDSSQVKRDCFLAYRLETENRKTHTPKLIQVKGYRDSKMDYRFIPLGAELYIAAEDMYLNIDLATMIASAVHPLDGSSKRKLLSNIVLTGGNCRLSGLSLRLLKDLQQLLPEYASVIRVVDPRLMTGRTDAVIGASYIRKWFEAFWVSRQDYILQGATGCMESAMAKQLHCV